MEITGVDRIQTLHKTHSKEGIAATRLEDTLTISADAQKKAEWVEKLKNMPDIRPEKIASPHSNKVLSIVAHKIATSGF